MALIYNYYWKHKQSTIVYCIDTIDNHKQAHCCGIVILSLIVSIHVCDLFMYDIILQNVGGENIGKFGNVHRFTKVFPSKYCQCIKT